MCGSQFAVIWSDRNARIFIGHQLTLESIQDQPVHVASLWCSANGLVKGVSLLDLQRDQSVMLHFTCY